jgi:hypothetical protein
VVDHTGRGDDLRWLPATGYSSSGSAPVAQPIGYARLVVSSRPIKRRAASVRSRVFNGHSVSHSEFDPAVVIKVIVLSDARAVEGGAVCALAHRDVVHCARVPLALRTSGYASPARGGKF